MLVDLAQRAESADGTGVYIWDHVAYRERGWPVADPYVTMAAIAGTTVRVRLGVMRGPQASSPTLTASAPTCAPIRNG